MKKNWMRTVAVLALATGALMAASSAEAADKLRVAKSGLSLLFECLTGVMAGTPIITTLAGLTGPKLALQNATVIVFNIANFRPLADYRRDVGLLIEVVKGLPRRDGFDELLLPGERGGREAELRRRDGIPFGAKLWRELGEIAQANGIAPPHARQ